MADTGYSRSPKIAKGAFVQLLTDIVGIIPNIVVFQYNPESISRTLTPWNPFAVDQAQRGSQAPTVQPFDVAETFGSFRIELDATDDLEDGDPIAVVTGIETRLAALRKLTQASEGLVGDLIASAKSLVGAGEDEARRPTVAPTLLVLGPRLILPVRVTSFQVEENAHLPSYFPIRAVVTMSLEVLTPDSFRCQQDIAGKIAVAAYEFTRLQEDANALLNVANNVDAIRAMLPF
ncbi:hypothetical protein Q4F19_17155 [Sphingomonas sp. BIUV-7]|uniref:Uncharacterized protein n=1 Tax=Sphingomonas natans TaxID=3063330 RepID=A0ABT8YCQ3_9SPHN|nr:hypothetical protein [Sphingomonas sp. BIUV-7]MDO6416117.1 hypothetical protein [Sphingomonas sp. BIUV-7]